MKLLIADDHTLFQDTLLLYLQRERPEFSVTAAKDLDEAATALEKNDGDFALVILDLCMPGMNGFEGLERIRRQ